MRVAVVLAVLFVAPLSDALTQQLPVQPGQRVRVTAPDLGIHQQAATFDAVNGGVLTVTGDSTMQCPLSDVTRLDVYAGRKSRIWTGAGIGALVGAGVGIGILQAEGGGCVPDVDEAVCTVGAAVAGALGGALLGGVVGAVIRTDKWEEVPLDRLRVSIVPTRGGIGIGARIAF